MLIKTLDFEEIEPFIRHIHLFDIEKGLFLPQSKAYDYRLMYIYSGEGRVTIGDIEYEAVKGNMFFWRPGVVYNLHAKDETPLAVIGINFDFTRDNRNISYPIPPENLFAFDERKIIEIIEFSDEVVFNKPIFLMNMQQNEGLLFSIINEYTTRKRFFMQNIRGYFLSLLADIARHVTSTFSCSEGVNRNIDQILGYIQENYTRNITNIEIGRHFNFHPVYINRILVKHTGVSLHQYIINYRISVAINLLQNSGKSVTEIASDVGFIDVNYFSKCFKRIVGQSPKNYIYTAPLNILKSPRST